MSSSVEHIEHTHEVDPQFLVNRARAGVLLLILSDAVSIISIIVAGGFLNSLNTMGQFRVAGDHAPALLPGVLLAVALASSGLAYFGWARTRTTAGPERSTVYIVSWFLMIAAFVFQVWIGATLGYVPPFHAYESLMELITWYSAFHLLLTSFIGLLVFGRIWRGRLAGREYIVEVTGYWWYYTVIAGLIMWLFSVLI